MTVELETRIRSTLEEMARTAPLANPERPRPGAGHGAGRGPQVDFKMLALVGCVLVLGAIVAFGVALSHATSPRAAPEATTSIVARPTTSLPKTGPYVVPNVVGMATLEAVDQLKAGGLTNSIDNLNCSGSIGMGQVVGQNPPAGFRAAFDSRVNLRISCATSSSSTTGQK